MALEVYGEYLLVGGEKYLLVEMFKKYLGIESLPETHLCFC